MLAIISPARNIRPTEHPFLPVTSPLFQKETEYLVRRIKTYSPWELESLLDVSPQRALELCDGYQAFDAQLSGTPALLSYYGAAFRNLSPEDFDQDDFSYAEKHLRILSALYGLLYPSGGILPYRLGLDKKFQADGQNLYQFWGDKIYRELFRHGELVVSLTSPEYAKLVSPHLKPEDRLITCRFLVQKPDGARGTVNSVRIARGQMARFLVKNKIEDPEDLKGFDWQGYRFIPGRSDSSTFVFIQG